MIDDIQQYSYYRRLSRAAGIFMEPNLQRVTGERGELRQCDEGAVI
jgi:hypothetical protein